MTEPTTSPSPAAAAGEGPRLCIATSVTDSFVPGALVMLHSFQRHNPEYRGDFVIFHDGLSVAGQTALRQLSDRVNLVRVSDRLRQWIDAVVSTKSALEAQRAQFNSLEALQLRGYAKVLLCDSDLLFRASMADLWSRSERLLVCLDGPGYGGLGRDRRTFAAEPVSAGSLPATFNSGFMLIDGSLLVDGEFDRVLASVGAEDWRAVVGSHTDQFVLNRAFAGRYELLDGTYNFLLRHAELQTRATGVGPADAKVVHFNVNAKPWQIERMIEFRPAPMQVLDAYEWWNDSFLDALRTLDLRQRLQGRA